MQIIPTNTATAALRRVPISLVDATDLYTPENIDPAGDKPDLSIGGDAYAAATEDLVETDGDTGQYYVQLTQAEVNQAAGTVIRGKIQPTGCALTLFECQIGPSSTVTETPTAAANAAATFARTFDATKMAGYTFEQLVGFMASVLLGKASGLAGTTPAYRNLGDTANAVSGTVDADGNRTAVTRTSASVV